MNTDTQPLSVDVPVYLLVEPQWKDRRWWSDAQGRPILEGAKVVKSTQGRPSIPREGVITKVTLRIPAAAFLPLQPEAVVVVSMDDLETIVVAATNPGEEPDA